MNMKCIHISLLIGLFLLNASASGADEEADFISILKSNAGVPAKCAACFQLRRVGTARSVPALARLLGQERLSHAARHALEGMPHPEAGAALRQALGESSGLNKAGLIDSLGWRAEPEAVPLLIPLLSDEDATIAAAAATSLGRIGGAEAIAALTALRNVARAGVPSSVQEALLKCAERLHAAGDEAGAVSVYLDVIGDPVSAPIRVAAWRGLALSDPARRIGLITTALSGTDRPIQRAALKLIRTGEHPRVLQACLRQWASLPADSQLALLDAYLMQDATTALPAIRFAMNSRHLPVRVAAWEALADVDDPSSIPALAQAAADGDAMEQEAARDSLSRVHGPGARAAILAHLDRAEPQHKAELLRALGERGDRATAKVLLHYAGAEAETVRLAALESLRKLALPEALTPLLALAARPMSAAERKPFMRTLYAVTAASPDRDQATRSVIGAFDRFPKEGRRGLLPLLGGLGTSAALEPVLVALDDPDSELVREAVRVLGQWPTAAPAAELLELARKATGSTLEILALRACIQVVGKEPDTAVRLGLLKESLSIARRDEEKKQALGQIGLIPTPAALETAVEALADPNLSDEASLAVLSIAEKLADAYPELVKRAATLVLAQCERPDLVERARALCGLRSP